MDINIQNPNLNTFKFAVVNNLNLEKDDSIILLRSFKDIENELLNTIRPYLEEKSKIEVNLDNWRSLMISNNVKFRCISICGRLETGKSYNLSKFLEYLNTKYVHKWKKPFTIPFIDADKDERNTFVDNAGKTRGIDGTISFDIIDNIAYLTLVLDSEGTGANISPRYDGLVNALLYLVSDVIIYNTLEKHDISYVMGMLNEMGYLRETCVELHKENSELHKPILLCLYNWVLDSSKDPYTAAQITSQKWNDQIIKCLDNKNELRGILSDYPKMLCVIRDSYYGENSRRYIFEQIETYLFKNKLAEKTIDEFEVLYTRIQELFELANNDNIAIGKSIEIFEYRRALKYAKNIIDDYVAKCRSTIEECCQINWILDYISKKDNTNEFSDKIDNIMSYASNAINNYKETHKFIGNDWTDDILQSFTKESYHIFELWNEKLINQSKIVMNVLISEFRDMLKEYYKDIPSLETDESIEILNEQLKDIRSTMQYKRDMFQTLIVDTHDNISLFEISIDEEIDNLKNYVISIVNENSNNVNYFGKSLLDIFVASITIATVAEWYIVSTIYGSLLAVFGISTTAIGATITALNIRENTTSSLTQRIKNEYKLRKRNLILSSKRCRELGVRKLANITIQELKFKFYPVIHVGQSIRHIGQFIASIFGFQRNNDNHIHNA